MKYIYYLGCLGRGTIDNIRACHKLAMVVTCVGLN